MIDMEKLKRYKKDLKIRYTGLTEKIENKINGIKETEEIKEITWTYSKLKELNKEEQIMKLKELGIKEMPELEKDRINKILEVI